MTAVRRALQVTASDPRRGLLRGLMITADALVVAAWLRWWAAVSPGTRPPSTASVLFLGLSALVFAGAMDRAGAKRATLRFAAPAGAAVAILLVARLSLYPGAPARDLTWIGQFAADVFHGIGNAGSGFQLAGIGVLAWWRGLGVATQRITPSRLLGGAAGWLSGLALLAVVVALTRPVALAPFIAGTAAVGLGVLGLGRLETSGGAGRPGGAGPGWYVAVGSGIALVLATAALVTAVVSLDAARALVGSLDPLPDVVIRLVVLAVLGLAKAILWVLAPIRAMLAAGLRDHPLQQPPPTPPETFDPQELLRATPAWQFWVIRATALGTLVVLAMLWLRRAVERYTKPVPERPVERRLELSAGAVAADLMGAATALRRRAAAALRGHMPGRRAGMRALYAGFLDAAAGRGAIRRPAGTPSEFALEAKDVFPGKGDSVEILTNAYLPARYDPGADPEAPAAALAAWARLSERQGRG